MGILIILSVLLLLATVSLIGKVVYYKILFKIFKKDVNHLINK